MSTLVLLLARPNSALFAIVKLPEHLSTYHTAWLSATNSKITLGPSDASMTRIKASNTAANRTATITATPADCTSTIQIPDASTKHTSAPPAQILRQLVTPPSPLTL